MPPREARRDVTAARPRANGRAIAAARVLADPNGIHPVTRPELMPIALAALVLSWLSLLVSSSRGWLLLYGDAVAHLGIARRILDARYPGIAQLGGVWLPLPHLLMMPFATRMDWWQTGLAGALPSMIAYVAAVTGCYALTRRLVPVAWAFGATAFFALNPNLLYLSSTAMTEPYFLAELLWSAVVTMSIIEALRASRTFIANTRMVIAGFLTIAMVLTRYDGWFVGAGMWCVLAWAWFRSEKTTREKTQINFMVMTVLMLMGPALWLGYNAIYQHDALDFIRGPYSAKAILIKTTPPGAEHYKGWHHPTDALIYFTRAAQLDAAAYESGFALMLAAIAGTWLLCKMSINRAALLLLWLPLPFYVYSITWGSVPVFLPQLYPHAYYNSRYGMVMLPALTIGAAALLVEVERRARMRSQKSADAVYAISLLLVVLNTVAITGAFGLMVEKWRGHAPPWLSRPPLVFDEGMVNSRTRIPFEKSLAAELRRAPADAILMMDTNDHIGAVQTAGIALKKLIGPLDSQSFDRAKEDPARYANLIYAMDGDPVAKAVAAHPQGLTEIEIICHTDQPCVHIYRSDRITQGAQ